MITLTPQAAKQIRISAEQSGAKHLALRLAAKKNPDGTLDYGIGFDEVKNEDQVVVSEEVEICFAPEYGPLLNGMTLDYVEFAPGEYRFIVMNPNDANYAPSGAGGCGSGGCGSGGCGSSCS